MVILEQGRIVERYQSLMNAGVRVPAFIEQLTGISNAMLRTAPSAEQVMNEVNEFVGITPLLAHNAAFDQKFWDFELGRIKRTRLQNFACSLLLARRLLAVLPEFTGTDDFRALALVFKRVRNIARSMPDDEFERLLPEAGAVVAGLTEPAERALAQEILARRGTLMFAADAGTGYREALAEAAKYGPSVATFFDDVLVMADDPKVRQARLFLMKALERQILRLADVSEIVPQES